MAMNTVDVTKDALWVSSGGDLTTNEARLESLCHVLFVGSDGQLERHETDF